MKIYQFGTPKIAKALKERVELASKSGQKSRKITQIDAKLENETKMISKFRKDIQGTLQNPFGK